MTRALLIMCFMARALPAQELPLFTDSLREGLRVRVKAPGITRFPASTGTITALQPDAFFFKDDRDGGVRRVPPASIRRLEVSTERGVTRNRVVAGAALGFLGGLGVAQILDYRDRKDDGTRHSECVSVVGRCIGKRSLVIGTVAGTAIGVTIASLRPGEIWREVRLR